LQNENIFPDIRPISTVAKQILSKRYFLKDEKTWDELVNRNINFIYDEKNENREITKQMILNRYFLPNSPSLANAGKLDAGLCACFVVDFNDTIDEIYKTKYEFALIARRGGGCGTSLSKLRPRGDDVRGSTHGFAGGPVAFADTISRDMQVITQGGLRSMAIMFTMSIYHPDIIQFITAKENEDDKKIENANMSVVVDNVFMELVKENKKYWTIFNNKKYKEYNAKDIFYMIVEGAWRNGEPGILFQNRINESPYKYTGQEIFSVNPCAEEPLPPNGVCNLGSFDISKFIKKDKSFDFEKFEIAIRLSIYYLDKIIDKSTYPTQTITEWAKNNRAIGAGIMGYADACLMLEISYGSIEAINFLGKVLNFMQKIAESESKILGEKLGIPTECKKLPEPRRNITLLTIAPTGTTSLISGCSSGIEPIFSEITIRNDKTGTYVFENNLHEKPYFKCAVSTTGEKEVTWEEHIKTLAEAQKYIDSGVSKTINFPTSTHRDTIAKAFFMAWELDCKGLAVYRNGSRKVEVLSVKNIKKESCPLCGEEIIKIDGKMKCINPNCKFILIIKEN